MAAVGGIAVGSDRENLKGVELVECTFQSFLPAIQTMVVGGEQDVETGVTDGVEVFIGSTEGRISLIGLPA